jgi:hypothetical protein
VTRTAIAALLAGFVATSAVAIEVAADHCIVGESVFGCRSERDIEQIISYHDDVAALREALVMTLAAGVCTPFADGERVIVTGHSAQSDRTEVQRPGDTESYWIAGSWSRPARDCSQGPSRSLYAKLGLPEPAEYRGAEVRRETASTPPTSRATTLSCAYKPVMTDAEIARCRKRQR